MPIRIWRFVLCLGLITFLTLASPAQDNGTTPGISTVGAQVSASDNHAQQHQAALAAQSQSLPKLPGRVHPLHMVRKIDPNRRITSFAAPLGARLLYFGGPVISNVEVVQVLYGAGSYDPQVQGTATPSMANFYADITNSAFMDFLGGQYSTNVPGGTGQTVGRGTFGGTFQIVPSPANDPVNNGFFITDDQVQAELLDQITNGHLPAPLLDPQGNPNTLYMIFFPFGVTINSGEGISCSSFCAYHSTTNATFNLKPVLYGVHPDFQAGSGCDLGCGVSTTFGNNTSVTSHELAEAITDADIGLAFSFFGTCSSNPATPGCPVAWLDLSGEEIGDLCEAQQGLYTVNGTAYVIQAEFSNAVLNCVLPPPTKSPDFSLAAGNVTVAAGGSGSSTVTVVPTGGFTGSVTLSVSGLPGGVTATFATNPTTSTSVLTFKASNTAAAGTGNITITGTSGTLTHTTLLALTIGPAQAQQLLGNPGFENGPTTTPWALTSGVINSSTSQPPHSGSWDAWLNGYGRTHTDSAVQTVSIPSTITSANLSFWLHIDTAETTKTAARDTLQVQVLNSSGAVLATLATFSNLNAAPGYQQNSFDLSKFKGQTVKVRFLGQENSSLQTSFVIDDTALNVQ